MVDLKHCIALLLLVGTCYCTSALSIMIDHGQDECFYISKGSGDTITASFQVINGDDSVDFTLLDPKRQIIYEHRDSDGYELEQKIHIGGDYGFCFANNARIPTGVHFEWDFHLGSQEEAQFAKKLEEEKRRFLMNKIKENQPKIIAGAAGGTPVEMHHDDHKQKVEEFEMDSLAHAMLLISFNADRMEHFMNQHKSKQTFSHNVQIKNAAWINYYSITIISLVLVMAFVQVVVVKSFFNGKINLKVWQF